MNQLISCAAKGNVRFNLQLSCPGGGAVSTGLTHQVLTEVCCPFSSPVFAQPGKSYATPEEEELRKQAWLKTRVRVTEHNRKYLNGEVTWIMGANMFADMVRNRNAFIISPSADAVTQSGRCAHKARVITAEAHRSRGGSSVPPWLQGWDGNLQVVPKFSQ